MAKARIGLIGLGAKNFCDHPEQADHLRADPGLLPRAIEECLRFEGPIGMTTRVLHADAEFGGFTIPADSTVWASLWSANRDPLRHPEPDRFDITRPDTTHLAFGAGTHQCLGAHLARMETQEALGALIRRTRSLEREEEGLRWGLSVFRVPSSLPVRVRAA